MECTAEPMQEHRFDEGKREVVKAASDLFRVLKTSAFTKHLGTKSLQEAWMKKFERDVFDVGLHQVARKVKDLELKILQGATEGFGQKERETFLNRVDQFSGYSDAVAVLNDLVSVVKEAHKVSTGKRNRENDKHASGNGGSGSVAKKQDEKHLSGSRHSLSFRKMHSLAQSLCERITAEGLQQFNATMYCEGDKVTYTVASKDKARNIANNEKLQTACFDLHAEICSVGGIAVARQFTTGWFVGTVSALRFIHDAEARVQFLVEYDDDDDEDITLDELMQAQDDFNMRVHEQPTTKRCPPRSKAARSKPTQTKTEGGSCRKGPRSAQTPTRAHHPGMVKAEEEADPVKAEYEDY